MKIGRNDLCPCGSGIKYKKCHERKVFTLRSEKYVVSVTQNGITYKIFQLFFYHKKNTDKVSIFVSFPYHKNSKGLLSLVTFPKNTRTIDKLSLVPGGKVTSHKIKYTHWKDGNVHFSQDGKIFTIKKDPSDRLDNGIGHLFTISVKGIKGFELKKDTKKTTSKEIDLDFNIPNDENDSLKITGWWHDIDTVHPLRNEFKTVYYYKQDDGPTNTCFALQPLPSSPLSNKVLFLCVRKEFMTKEKGTHLLFIGGFDQRIRAKDLSNDLHFLAMLYPARNYNVLKEKIGTVDFSAQDFKNTID